MSRCDRCGKETYVTQMSMFNTDILCLDCLEEERGHSDYQAARAAERAAVEARNRYFSGIGKPVDL